MKKILFYLALSIPTMALAQDCLKNAALSEPMLVPTQQDTLNYQQIIKRYPTYQLPPFSYQSAIYTRGMADTALLWGNNPAPISASLKSTLVSSPLIVEGIITDITNADTSKAGKNMFYMRTFTIQVKNVVKSKYKLAAGEKIQVKTNLNGYRRYRNGVRFSTSRMVEFYETGKTYLFVLDKYEYMQNMYRIKTKDPSYINYYDEYCPTAFSFVPSTIGISKEYAAGKFTIDDLKKYLNKK